MSIARRFSRFISRFGHWVTTIIEFIVLISAAFLAGLAVYVMVRQFLSVKLLTTSTAELTMLVNSVFMLIIFAEIVRCVAAAHGRPEAYVLAVAEAGFVIAVREIFVSALTHQYKDLLLSSGAALIMGVTLWIIRGKVLKT